MTWSRFVISAVLLLWSLHSHSQFVIQNAGNMGLVSAGVGIDYGKHKQWETYMLLGYIPKHQSSRAKLTLTLKENYIPWSIGWGRGGCEVQGCKGARSRWSIEPLTASIYLNTIFGNEFWMSQPDRYPDGYYGTINTRWRLNVALGQRVTWHLQQKNEKKRKSISLFYEVSTCDLYLSEKFENGSIPLKDLFGLSIGVKLRVL